MWRTVQRKNTHTTNGWWTQRLPFKCWHSPKQKKKNETLSRHNTKTEEKTFGKKHRGSVKFEVLRRKNRATTVTLSQTDPPPDDSTLDIYVVRRTYHQTKRQPCRCRPFPKQTKRRSSSTTAWRRIQKQNKKTYLVPGILYVYLLLILCIIFIETKRRRYYLILLLPGTRQRTREEGTIIISCPLRTLYSILFCYFIPGIL